MLEDEEGVEGKRAGCEEQSEEEATEERSEDKEEVQQENEVKTVICVIHSKYILFLFFCSFLDESQSMKRLFNLRVIKHVCSK